VSVVATRATRKSRSGVHRLVMPNMKQVCLTDLQKPTLFAHALNKGSYGNHPVTARQTVLKQGLRSTFGPARLQSIA